MAASVTSHESGGLGDVTKDDEKQNEKAGDTVRVAETSSKGVNLRSGEGDRQKAEIVHRYDADEGSSVDYPMVTSSAETSQVTRSEVLIQASSTEESETLATVASPDAEFTVASPDAELTVASPDAELTVASPDAELTVASPDAELTVASPDAELTEASPDAELTVASPDAELTVASPDAELTVASPDAELTVARPDAELTVASPDAELTVASPDAELTVASHDAELTVARPDAELTVASHDAELTVASPDAELTVASPDAELTVASPDAELTVASHDAELTVEQTNTEQHNIYALGNSSEEVNTGVKEVNTGVKEVNAGDEINAGDEEVNAGDKDVNAGERLHTSSQDGSVSGSVFAREDSLKQNSEPSENVSLVKHKLKSEVSEEDNVFDDGTKTQSYGTKTQSSEITSISSEPSNLKPASDEPTSDSQQGKLEKEVREERPVREMLVRRSRTESTDSNTDRPFVEPLTFSATKKIETIKDKEKKANDMCECLLCERSYPAYNKEDILAHMVLMHKFVIADVNFIGILPEYMRYWKKRFEDKPYSEFCSKIVTNAGVEDDASKEEFFLLCDALPEDKALREDLQRKKLESVLAQQQREREETKFCRQCLFCNQTFCGNRHVLLDHLVRDHTFHVGQPDNLVFTDELFDLIQLKLDSLLCLYCEKAFKDKPSLREHMRKKQHRKINPKHKEFDRFYIVNYMEMGKNWQSLQSEDSRLEKPNEKSVNEEDEWSGWNEESASKFVCLFCDATCVAVTDLLEHMKEKHSFDLHELSTNLKLNFYQKVKIINFIRKQVYLNICYGCQQTFTTNDELIAHLDESPTHSQNLPDAEAWDQEIYFVPTYEDDRLLCTLEDDYDDDDNTGDGAAGDNLVAVVIKEDIPIPDTILLKDKKLCQDLLKT